MNVFEEFKRLIGVLEKQKVRYALKRTRYSKQDQADIEKLEDDKNR